MKVIEAVKYLSNLLRYMQQSIPAVSPLPPCPPSSSHRAFARLFRPGGGAFTNFDYDENPNTSLLESCKLINDVEISFSKFEYKDCNITLSLAKDTSEPKTSVYYSWQCARVH